MSPAFRTLIVFGLLTGAFPLLVGLVWLGVNGSNVTSWVGIGGGIALLVVVIGILRAAKRREDGVGQARDPKDNWMNNGVNNFGRKHPVLGVAIVVLLFVGAISLRVFT